MNTTVKIETLSKMEPRQGGYFGGYTEGAEMVVYQVKYDWGNPQDEEDFEGCDLKSYNLQNEEERVNFMSDYHLEEEGFYSYLQCVGDGGNAADTDTQGPFETAEEAEEETRAFFAMSEVE